MANYSNLKKWNVVNYYGKLQVGHFDSSKIEHFFCMYVYSKCNF